jgi:isocitrate dehydrogenase
MDNLPQLAEFAEKLEAASLDTLTSGTMTTDLTGLVEPDFNVKSVNSWEFIEAIVERL